MTPPSVVSRFKRGSAFGLLASVVAFALACIAAPDRASAETRTLSVYFTHTKETTTVVYKRNGRYVPEGLATLNRALRDWRRNESTKMDPRLFDIIWEVHRATGSRRPVHVVSAYRSPTTNAALRSRSRAVAKFSQHMLGKAMDFYLPDVPVAKIRAVAFKMQAGGVGFYPTSNTPFVHLDTGNVRAWPRMTRQQLVSLFPDGKTVHIPADGKPLAGYNAALAEVRRGRASALAYAESASPKRRGLIAMLFGGGADEVEDNAESAGRVPVPTTTRRAPAAQPPAVAASAPAAAPAPEQAPVPAIVAPPLPQRAPQNMQAPTLVARADAPPFGLPTPRALPPMPRGRPMPAADTPEATIALAALPRHRPAFEPAADAVGLVLASLPAARPTADLPPQLARPAKPQLPVQVAAYAPSGTGDGSEMARLIGSLRGVGLSPEKGVAVARASAAATPVPAISHPEPSGTALRHPKIASADDIFSRPAGVVANAFSTASVTGPATGGFVGPAVVRIRTVSLDGSAPRLARADRTGAIRAR